MDSNVTSYLIHIPAVHGSVTTLHLIVTTFFAKHFQHFILEELMELLRLVDKEHDNNHGYYQLEPTL